MTGCHWGSIAKWCMEGRGRSVILGVTDRINSKFIRSVFSPFRTYLDTNGLKARSDTTVENWTDLWLPDCQLPVNLYMHFRCRYFWNRTTWTSLDLQLCVRVQQLHTKKWLRRETTTDLLTFTNHNRREVHRRYIRCRTVKNYAPLIFDGVHRDPEEWLAHFRRYVACLNLSEADQLAFFPLFLQHRAIDWYDTLKPQDRTTIDQLLGEVNRFFCPSA